MAPYVERAISRVPIAGEIGIRTFFCGPESFTPDLSPVLGEAPELPGYFVAAGLNSIGILTGGGVGRVLAHWILDGRPDVDVTAMNIDRLHVYQSNPEYRRTRTVESLGMVYQCHYPGRSMTTARGAQGVAAARTGWSPQGAWFKDVSGWEGADWYAGPGVTPDPGPLTWGRPGCWAQWAAEHRACREGVIVMDMSFMSKFRVQGRDAGPTLERISANRVDGDPGMITYTQWLNEGGTIEADLTVTKLDDGDFLVVATDTAHRHVETWMRRAFGDAARVRHRRHVRTRPAQRPGAAVTSAAAAADVRRPVRRGVPVPHGTVDRPRLRPGAVRADHLPRRARLRAVRPDRAGRPRVRPSSSPPARAFGLRHAGLRALGSLRMEKGYRDYGHDIDNTDDPLAAGLGFAVDWSTGLRRRGRRCDGDPAAARCTRRLVQVQLSDPEPLLFHAEVVSRDGIEVGYVRSASYGHTLGGAVGLAMVDAGDEAVSHRVARRAARGRSTSPAAHVAAIASLTPLYDPKGTRIRT